VLFEEAAPWLAEGAVGAGDWLATVVETVDVYHTMSEWAEGGHSIGKLLTDALAGKIGRRR
jgi:hypothetical protein